MLNIYERCYPSSPESSHFISEDGDSSLLFKSRACWAYGDAESHIRK